MQKWEYKVLTRILGDEEEKLNQLGQQGWELCAVHYDSCRYYYFKRPLTIPFTNTRIDTGD
jgi:hypothetical protein